MTTTLVTGGTGRLGRALVPRLLDAGHRVRVLTRGHRERAAHDWAVGDLRTGTGLPDAVAGTDVIVHLATTNGRGDVPATARLLEAAAAAGAPHVLYVSIVGVDDAALGYYRAKRECERLVETSGLPWTLLRTTQFHDLVAALCDVQRWLPATAMPAGVDLQPVDVTDVAERLVSLAGAPPARRVADLGGPEIRSAAELARTYLRAVGRRRPVVRVPLPGRVIRDYRAGIQLTPGNAFGRVTFDDFLARGRR